MEDSSRWPMGPHTPPRDGKQFYGNVVFCVLEITLVRSAYEMQKTLRQECYDVIKLDCDVTVMDLVRLATTTVLQHHNLKKFFQKQLAS